MTPTVVDSREDRRGPAVEGSEFPSEQDRVRGPSTSVLHRYGSPTTPTLTSLLHLRRSEDPTVVRRTLSTQGQTETETRGPKPLTLRLTGRTGVNETETRICLRGAGVRGRRHVSVSGGVRVRGTRPQKSKSKPHPRVVGDPETSGGTPHRC